MQAKKKNTSDFRSNCPISSTLDILGDKWSLLILRDLSLFDKRSFGEFAESPEHIATNILSDRLKRLEEHGLVKKSKAPDNKKSVHYFLTEKGIDIVPILAEYVLWGARHMEFPIHKEAQQLATALGKDRKGTLEKLRKKLIKLVN